MKCTDCGKSIVHAYYIDGKPYGYSCYRKLLAIRFKQWEDEKNAEYAIECFSAMEVFKGKANNTFHDSICKQWEECKKLTGKQLSCIKSGFSDSENITFLGILFTLSEDNFTKKVIAGQAESLIQKKSLLEKHIDDEILNKMLLHRHPCGFHYYIDTDCKECVFFSDNGKYTGRTPDGKKIFDTSFLDLNTSDEYLEILKVVTANN